MNFKTDKSYVTSIRIPFHEYDYITRYGDSPSKGILRHLRVLMAVEAECTKELIKLFTPNEWKYMAYQLQRETMAPELLANKAEFIRTICGVQGMRALSDQLDCDVPALRDKLAGLTSAHVLAIYTRVWEYWLNTSVDIDEWARF